jgi:hypothetical protein
MTQNTRYNLYDSNLMKRFAIAVIFCLCKIVSFAQPVFNAVKENLGTMINDANDQVLPVFTQDKKTLYFSQNTGINGTYEVWQSQLEPNGQFTPKQRARFISGPSALDQYIFNTFSNGLFLINGKFENKQSTNVFEKGFSWYSNKSNQFQITATQTLQIDGLDEMLKGKIANAFYHDGKKVLFLSFATTATRNIYVCTPKPGQAMPYLLWNKPVALPNIINTEWEESCPFLDESGTILYFSSNRPGGYGGDDIYYTQLLSTDFTQWSTPKNLGFYVNSNKSELYYSVSSKDSTAYFVSYKNSYGAGDIFRIRFSITKQNKKIPIATGKPTTGQNTIVKDTATVQPKPLVVANNSNLPTITKQQLPLEEYKPNNLVLLLDISASMSSNNKMNFLKKASDQLLTKLRYVDKISLVTFGDEAHVVFQTGSLRDKDSLLQVLQKLEADQTETFLNPGLQKAYTQAIANFIPNGNNEILVITDGYFSVHSQSVELINKNPQIKLNFVLIDAGGITNNITNYIKRLLPNSSIVEMVNENTDVNKLLELIKEHSKK